MRKLLEKCPACAGELVVTQQTCRSCGTMVVGEFTPNIFSKLTPENLHFVELFVKNKGNVKEMEREIGLSYWTIRNRLNEIVEALGFENKDVEPATTEETLRQSRQEILARVDRGEIDVQEAAQLLKQLKPAA
ncbi:MAG: DUF2089 domain-containing protein [Anaerolineae bacterium]|jgi:hypothetical protein|nr:DUF2089 domain-containing protein [Anaerolineae bacterium]